MRHTWHFSDEFIQCPQQPLASTIVPICIRICINHIQNMVHTSAHITIQIILLRSRFDSSIRATAMDAIFPMSPARPPSLAARALRPFAAIIQCTHVPCHTNMASLKGLPHIIRFPRLRFMNGIPVPLRILSVYLAARCTALLGNERIILTGFEI